MISRTKFMNKYFEKIRDDISFITLKKGATINFKDKSYITKEELPVPARIQRLMEDINKQEEYDGVTINNIIDGIICIQATDESFEFLDEYHEMLRALNFDLVPYIMHCINNFDDNQNDDGVIYGKALINIKRDEKTCFIYASVLEKRGSDSKAKNAETKNKYFLQEAHEYYEKCLDYDEKFSLSYYKLGYYYKLNQQYVKAEIFWNKHQEIDDDPLRIDEIRKELIDLKPYVDYENGFNLVLKGNPAEGLELLLPLVTKFNGWWSLLFFIGLAYRMLGEYSIAETYFENVLKIEENQKDALNELGLCKMCRGKYTEAEELFTTILNLEPGNCEIFCNRAVACLYNGLIDRAKEDIQVALKINPNDETAIKIKAEIENYKS